MLPDNGKRVEDLMKNANRAMNRAIEDLKNNTMGSVRNKKLSMI